jgi:hypothetical protein
MVATGIGIGDVAVTPATTPVVGEENDREVKAEVDTLSISLQSTWS